MKLCRKIMIGGVLSALVSCHPSGKGEPDPWPPVSMESRPWTRWWWMGSAVDSGHIATMLEQYREAGFGGVEITPIYGVRGMEERYLDFLSGPWISLLEYTVTRAAELDMGVDMNQGTGWPFGGPMVTPDIAAGRVVVEKVEFRDGAFNREPEGLILARVREPGVVLEAITAYGPDGRVEQLGDRVDRAGVLDWEPPGGDWDLYYTFCGRTGQYVKRAAPGGEGYSLDHFSEEGVRRYLQHFSEALQGISGIRSFFNDSYEVYNASWTPGLFEQFRRRRGYDLRDHIRIFAGEEYDPEVAARIKCDYRQTLAEMLLEHFTEPWTRWANQRGGLTRNQAHGSPGNLIDLYGAVDIPECETFGHTRYEIAGLRQYTSDRVNVEPDPFMLKLATSAAHLSGKRLISNETFTWLGEHFKVTLAQCKPEAEEALLAGINHIFYHGTTYSPGDEPWPGWIFYASTHFGPTNTFWSHLKGLNQYITRCQSLLQTGRPENEILVYWPVWDIWSDPEGLEKQISVDNIESWLTYPAVRGMVRKGYNFDFISDRWIGRSRVENGRILTSREGLPYRTLVIPACRYMPLETLEAILALARDGALVVFEKLPEDVPGYPDYGNRRIRMEELLGSLDLRSGGDGIQRCRTGSGRILVGADLSQALSGSGIGAESLARTGLKYTRRTLEDGHLYFVVNHTPRDIDTTLSLNVEARRVEILDPLTGAAGNASSRRVDGRTLVRVQLASGQSLFLRTRQGGPALNNDWPYAYQAAAPFEIKGTWTLEFRDGGPVLPGGRTMSGPEAWTDLGDTILQNYSGTGIYSVSFWLDDLPADDYLLDLGEVFESALVKVNGQEAGIVFSHPFTLNIGPTLNRGENRLSVEVANLMANRIAYMDRIGAGWKKFRDINFVNLAYEPFDATGWQPMRSGLGGPVRLIPMQWDREVP